MSKKILLSVLCGLTILIITWVYQNYDFSFNVEDGFFKKFFLWKNRFGASDPSEKASFVFINTGKDLALVDDSVEYGNVTVSDREKIYRFIHAINGINNKPVFTVLD